MFDCRDRFDFSIAVGKTNQKILFFSFDPLDFLANVNENSSE